MGDEKLSRRDMMRIAGSVAAGSVLGAASIGAGSAAFAAPGGNKPRPVKQGPGMVCYVEVNNQSMLNVGRYKLAKSGANAFDIGIVFASNINNDGTGRVVLHHNENVTRVLQNVDTEIRPLQKQGIKVLLSILGNHGGVGFANFQTYDEADAFAAQLADAVYTYELDGIDFDDEWARYDLGHPVNAWSFPYLVKALRTRMPDKVISLYWYGPITETLEYEDIRVGELIDYSWNALYGTWIVPEVPGLGKDALAPAAVNLTATDPGTATLLATRTVAEEYGLYNTYNLTSADASAYLTPITIAMNGERTVYTG